MKWIKCSERLPKEEGEYLTTIRLMDNKFIAITFFGFEEVIDGKERWKWDDYNITHWQPLPDPPGDDE